MNISEKQIGDLSQYDWAVHNELDAALRSHLGVEVPFRLHVAHSKGRLKAEVLIPDVPTPGLRSFCRTLEAEMAAEGYPVEIDLKHGDVHRECHPELKRAKEAFDQAWKTIPKPASASSDAELPLAPPVRDFIYLDVERLASLFAQCRRGLTTLIALQERGVQSGTVSRDRAEASVSFDVEKFQGEMSVLHDYMYHLVEVDLGTSILDVSAANLDDASGLAELRTSRLCKVAGRAEVQDYRRLATFIEKFNEIGEAIAYSILKSADVAESLSVLQQNHAKATGKKKHELRQQVAKLSDAKRFAQEAGLQQDEKLLKNLRLIIDLFCADVFEVRVVPCAGRKEPAFRTLLRKEFLRVPPERLRLLYGAKSQDPWTLVGSVTYVTGFPTNEGEAPGNGEKSRNSSTRASASGDFSMRHAFTNLFDAMGLLENAFVDATDGREVVVFPLAIYRHVRE